MVDPPRQTKIGTCSSRAPALISLTDPRDPRRQLLKRGKIPLLPRTTCPYLLRATPTALLNRFSSVKNENHHIFSDPTDSANYKSQSALAISLWWLATCGEPARLAKSPDSAAWFLPTPALCQFFLCTAMPLAAGREQRKEEDWRPRAQDRGIERGLEERLLDWPRIAGVLR
jgi:hypothetical protein